MPWSIVKNSRDCPSSKPYGVKKDDSEDTVGCHETIEAAQAHMAALYASVSDAHMGDVELREFTNDQLETLGSSGKAFKNHTGQWSYPIENVQDLKNAIQAFGRSAEQDRSRLRAYIIRRARVLKQSELIPENWRGGREMTMPLKATYLVDISDIELSETDGIAGSWVHALPIGAYKHPKYGTIDITVDRIKRFADNVKSKIRGIDPSINYNHNNDDEAAGWVKDADARSDGLWVFVEWVKEAAEKIKSKKYRYFSSEFDDVWVDPKGNEIKDVFFGGGLTNRPFMKNLVPINLSEATVDNAFELVSLVSGQSVETLKGGSDMDLSDDQLNKIVEGVTAKLAESLPKQKQLNEDDASSAVKLMEIEELRELSEKNPLVKTLINAVEMQGVNIAKYQDKLRETRIQHQLAEFDKSKIVLTPVAKDLVLKLLSEMPENLEETFWKLMDNMRRSQSFLVELGEKSGATAHYGFDKSPTKRLNDMTGELIAKGMDYASALEKVAKENPSLYQAYRDETYAFKN